MADIDDIIREWWDYYQVDSRASYDNIISGLRKPQVSDSNEVVYDGGVVQPISKSQRQTGACQYWINGLPSPCSNWDHEQLKCVAELAEGESLPSGYGVGKCDMLGRRDWCSKYVPSKDIDLKEFVCIAPCIEKSGLGKQNSNDKKRMSYRAFLPSEIKGYNPDDSGVGRCDGWGLGRGAQRESYENLESLYKDGVICGHYRPHQMGFGAIQPRPFHGSDVAGKPFDAKVNTIPTTLDELHDGSAADPLSVLDKRLPFVFQVYNARAMYQKCAHWNNTKASFFVMSSESDISLQSIGLDDGIYCECSDSACIPYKEEMTVWPNGVPWIVWEVTAKYGGIICNGAKPECPCYTGKWIYCTDNNMRDGMRVSADQMFELRFWTSDWASQAEYDAYYTQKPGRTFKGNADESNPYIYTFTKWNKLDVNDPNNSIMEGYRHSMCMPAPLHMREFIPSMYITKRKITYPKINSTTGTNSPGLISFPTLVRELENIYTYTPNITVIYPYSTVDPWEIEVCQQEEVVDFCIHNSNLMSDPYISVIGQTSPNCDMYIVNKNILEKDKVVTKACEYMDKYIRANQIVDNDTEFDYNYRIDKLISYCEEQNDGYAVTLSNDKGVFLSSNVKLKANSLNELYIICKFTDDPFPEYVFRKIKVKSVYWGALITQSSMTHAYFSGTGNNAFPKQFEPGATITGNVLTTTGNIDKILPMYKQKNVTMFNTKIFYGYCLNEYEQTVVEVEHWTRVGSSGYIFAEIDNLELSYLWEFGIVEAYLKIKIDENSDSKKPKINLCGAESDSLENVKIQLSVVNVPKKSLPPNAILLKSDEPMGFFNGDWKLTIKYKYRILETSKVNPVWPVGMDGEFSSIKFRNSPFSIIHAKNSNTFVIERAGTNLTKATMSVMALITDDDGRVQAAAATKMLMQGCSQGNRNVEIEYIYSADATSYKLTPEGGFATWRGPDTPFDGGGGGHFMRAYCGDHRCQTNNCIGPMWYPFDNCTKFTFYDFYTPAAQCYMYMTEGEGEVEKIGLGAWRYGVAPEYTCWVAEAGNWAATCGSQWRYYYSKASMSSMRFSGVAQVVSFWGGLESFEFMQWTPPPFLLACRAHIDRFVVKDFHSYLSYASLYPASESSYMPVVFTGEDLLANMDCFSGGSFTGAEISYFPMLSNYVADFAGESMSSNRYRFEDILQTIMHTGCSYPEPLIEFNDDYYAIRYSFRNENHVWAWPEYWKTIERGIESDYGKFNFLSLYMPSYYLDFLKMEHRFVIDEGDHTIIFTPPEGSQDGTGMSKYPSISIDGQNPRYFEILYSNYTSSNNIAWKDESSTGEVGSSDGDNIYELANNGVANATEGVVWLHSFDTLFDSSASEIPDINRMFFIGQDSITKQNEFGYFNRGLVANIPINRLKFLPVELRSAGNPHLRKEIINEIIYYWDLEGEYGIAPIEINIQGFYGVRSNPDNTTDIFDRPSISVVESEDSPVFSVDVTPDWPENSSAGYMSRIDGLNLTTLKPYDIEFKLTRTPDRLTKNYNYFMVKLGAGTSSKLFITNLDIKVGKYTTASESIKVWERKFRVGVSSSSSRNSDGPNSMALRSKATDASNSGQYFPFSVSSSKGFSYDYGRPVYGYTNNGDPKGGGGDIVDYDPTSFWDVDFLKSAGSTMSKMNIASFTEYVTESEVLDANMGNLKDIERDAQKDEYEKATALENYDELYFSPVVHPLIYGWLDSINGNIGRHGAMILQYDKLTWDKSKYPKWLKQDADFWQPGGHYFAWGDSVLRTKCYNLGPVEDVFDVEFVHNNHAGGRETVMDAGHAYAGYGRVQYAESKYWTAQALKLENQETTPDLLTGARNGILGGNG